MAEIDIAKEKLRNIMDDMSSQDKQKFLEELIQWLRIQYRSSKPIDNNKSPTDEFDYDQNDAGY